MGWDKDFVWHFATSQTANGQQFNLIDEVPLDVLDRLDDATSLLAFFSVGSELAALEHAHREYVVVEEECRQTPRSNPAERQRKVAKELDAFLAAFKQFVDRTKHKLSSRFGSASAPYRVFDAALSWEYDHDLTYPICCKLRDYGQHRGSPISRIIMLSRELPSGERVHIFRPVFDCNELRLKYDKWGPRASSLLEALGAIEVDVEIMFRGLLRSCQRAFRKLVMSEASSIRDAIETIRDIGNKCQDHTGRGRPLITGVPRDYGGLPDEKLTFKMTDVRLDLADLLERYLTMTEEQAPVSIRMAHNGYGSATGARIWGRHSH